MSCSAQAVGRLVADAELKIIQGRDRAVLKFRLATDRPGGKEGADFFNVEMWVKPTDKRKNYLTKGTQVSVTGWLEIDQYESGGQARQSAKIIADSFTGLTLLGRTQSAAPEAAEPQPVAVATTKDDDDDVPF